MNTKRKVRKKINKKLLIIFDIDDTLIKSFSIKDQYITSYKNTEFLIMKRKNKDDKILLIRKYTRFLLDYCFKYLDVAFWSSGMKEYVYSILKLLLTEEQYKKTKFILCKNKANDSSTEYIDLISKHKINISDINDNYIKPLDSLFIDEYFKKFCKKSKTLLVDDNLSHIAVNPKNSLLVPKYNYSSNDNYLFNVFSWIKENKSKNIQKISLKLFDFSEKITTSNVEEKYKSFKESVQIGDFIKVDKEPPIFGYVTKVLRNKIEIVIYDYEPLENIKDEFKMIKIEKKDIKIYDI